MLFIFSFQENQFVFEKSQLGARPRDMMGSESVFIRTGTWSLPMCGPVNIVAVMASCGDIKVRSIME